MSLLLALFVLFSLGAGLHMLAGTNVSGKRNCTGAINGSEGQKFMKSGGREATA